MKAACSSKTLAKHHFSVKPSGQKIINISLLVLYYHISLGCGLINLLCKLAKKRKLQKNILYSNVGATRMWVGRY
jgi:hypothetical protein